MMILKKQYCNYLLGFLLPGLVLLTGCSTPVETINKNTDNGLVNGNINEAKFNHPQGIAIDNNDNLFIVDSGNNLIRKVTPSGTVSVFAGSTQGFKDGKGSEAQFDTPFAIAVDKENNLYITDSGNHRVRKISADTTVTTIAGNNTEGGDDGTGTEARFSSLEGITIDKNNNLYVIDRNYGPIRKITPDAKVTTLKYKENSPDILSPRWICSDSKGNIYVTDQKNQFGYDLYKINTENLVSVFIPKSKTKFPEAITIDNHDNLFVVNLSGTATSGSDRGKSNILKISPEGNISDITSGDFFEPNSLTISNQKNILYLANADSNSINKIQLQSN